MATRGTGSRHACRLGLLLILALATTGLVASTGFLGGSAVAASATSAELRMIRAINAERRAAGLPLLRVDAELQRVARGWTAVMAGEEHLYHNPDLGTQVDRDWQRLGENVGWSHLPGASEAELVDIAHQYFMDSPEHRAKILHSDFTQVGTGVHITADGTLWTTVNFMQVAGPPSAAFHDVNGGPHAPAIRAVALHGVMQGCAPELFCPNQRVTRGEMASALARARDLPPVVGDRFSDIAGSPHRDAINAVTAAGIADGCGQSLFCPDAAVTRAQMASFLRSAWELPVHDPAQRFSDVAPASVHSLAVNALAEAGFTQGCATGRYCPGEEVRRAEMASFLARALGLV